MSDSRTDLSALLEKKKTQLQVIREKRRHLELLKKEKNDVEEAAHKIHLDSEEEEKQYEKLHSNVSTSISNATTSIDTSFSTNSNAVKKRISILSVATVQSTNIPPKETVTYSKQTQTTPIEHERDSKFNLTPDLQWENEFTVFTQDDGRCEDEEISVPQLRRFVSKLPPGCHGFPQVKEVEQEHQIKQKTKEVRELCEEEKQMIIRSENFQHFIDRKGRIMERVLCESIDSYTDYLGGAEKENLGEKSQQRISLNRYFFDKQWSRNRCVTSMDWSLQFPELLLASYNSNEDSSIDPDGVVLIWNTKFKKTTPEFIFHCQSAVLSAIFAKFRPNLILGGTYSGQIVLWDNRVYKRTPVQRTPVSTSAHTHPVYCMSMVGTRNAHNLVSISTDGRFCSWSLDMLRQPQETLELNRSQFKTVSVTCSDFPHSETNNFVFGTEEKAAYSACRHGTKAGIVDIYNGHQGPVTGISVNTVPGGIDFSHMFLTSSIDWTIKLWSLKNSKPIYSFENNSDYVLDVKWSPVHPALFAAVDGSGRLHLWNLNQDTKVPTDSVTVEGNPSLNRVLWTPSGLHLTVGDNEGKIWMYDVPENFAFPHHDEWNNFFCATQELKNNQVEEELTKLNYSDSNTPLSRMGSIITTASLQ